MGGSESFPPSFRPAPPSRAATFLLEPGRPPVIASARTFSPAWEHTTCPREERPRGLTRLTGLKMIVIGLDVGTQGVRAIAVSETGMPAAVCREPLPPRDADGLQEGWAEQDPAAWWSASATALQRTVDELRCAGRPPQDIKAVCVTSTSGTLVPVDASGKALRPAIMYNDCRAVDEALAANTAGAGLAQKMGYQFKPTFALPKMLWLKRHEPATYHSAARFLNAADFIAGKLTGEFSTTDTSNALKMGYDLVDMRWPRFITRELELEERVLPSVIAVGSPAGRVHPRASAETGLPASAELIAGATDGVASLIASGAAMPGEWNSTIGTTLVVKGVAREKLKDSDGRFYCHLHPEGYWLPGGASSVGGECLQVHFPDDSYPELDRQVPLRTPTSLVIYPLARMGERLPFVNPEAEGFMIGRPRDRAELFSAYLEGVAMVERWIYELLSSLNMEIGELIYSTGGGARSDEWMQVRANVLNRPVCRPRLGEAAYGAAIIAASQVFHHGSLSRAAKAMVKADRQWDPVPEDADQYNVKYRKFREACRAIGYE